MVVDLKRLSEALGRSSPEEDLRNDLQRIIHARKQEIEYALAKTGTYLLRVPDGRKVRISRRIAGSPIPEAASGSAH